MGIHIPGITKLTQDVFEAEGDHVVMLDGIGHDGRDMLPMGKYLQQAGYRAIALGYPSTSLPIERIADQFLPEKLARLVPDDGRTLHFVTHSMGGIVLRQYLYALGQPRLGRVVMIAPPNHGSPIAEMLKDILFYDWYFGPAGSQLCDGRGSLPKALPSADFDLGVIAGNISLDPWFDPLFDEPHDGKVAVSSTRLKGMREHRVVTHSHYGIHRSRRVYALVLNYLRNGSFE